MKYRLRNDMRFMKSGMSLEHLVIPEGTVVDAVHLNTLPDREKAPLKRLVDRLQKRDPSVRVLLFRYEGVVRSCISGTDVTMVHSRKRFHKRS